MLYVQLYISEPVILTKTDTPFLDRPIFDLLDKTPTVFTMASKSTLA